MAVSVSLAQDVRQAVARPSCCLTHIGVVRRERCPRVLPWGRVHLGWPTAGPSKNKKKCSASLKCSMLVGSLFVLAVVLCIVAPVVSSLALLIKSPEPVLEWTSNSAKLIWWKMRLHENTVPWQAALWPVFPGQPWSFPLQSFEGGFAQVAWLQYFCDWAQHGRCIIFYTGRRMVCLYSVKYELYIMWVYFMDPCRMEDARDV